jgi:hypothetical protein
MNLANWRMGEVMPEEIKESRRAKFEQAVIDRMKESGFLEVEVRVECLVRSGDGYYDGSIDAYWHFWNAALDGAVVDLPNPVKPESDDDACDDSWLDGFNAVKRYRKTCVAAVEAAGLKVKP